MLGEVIFRLLVLQSFCSIKQCEGWMDNALVTINGEGKTAAHSPQATVAGLAQYSFMDAEVVDIDCYNNIGHESKLEYYTSSGDNILSTGVFYNNITLKLKLTEASDKNYVYCIVGNTDLYKTKVTFFLQRTDKHNYLEVFINKMKINPQASKTAKYTFSYTHKFRIEDKVTILCRNKNDNGSLVKIDHYNETKTAYSDVSLKLKKPTTNELIVCKFVSGTTVSEYVAITLVLDTSDFYVSGLPQSNITEQYQKSPKMIFMRYQYSAGENLTLVCTKHSSYSNPNTQISVLKWINGEDFLNGSNVKNVGTRTWNKNKAFYLNIVFTLMPYHDNSTLKCTEESHKGIVKQIVINFNYVSTPQDEQFEESTRVLMIVGCGTVIILSVCCFIFCIRMRINKNRQKRGGDEIYENLTSRTDSSHPHPAQLEEPTYAEVHHSHSGSSCDPRNYNQPYAKPKPKKKRDKNAIVEEHYANLESYQLNDVADYVNNKVAYAEVAFDNSVGTTRPVPKLEDAVYTEVTVLKGTSIDNKYGNVFDNSGYVNTHTDCEYAELVCREFNNI